MPSTLLSVTRHVSEAEAATTKQAVLSRIAASLPEGLNTESLKHTSAGPCQAAMLGPAAGSPGSQECLLRPQPLRSLSQLSQELQEARRSSPAL